MLLYMRDNVRIDVRNKWNKKSVRGKQWSPVGGEPKPRQLFTIRRLVWSLLKSIQMLCSVAG